MNPERMPQYPIMDRGVVNQAVIAMKRHPKMLAVGVVGGLIAAQLPSLANLAWLYWSGLV